MKRSKALYQFIPKAVRILYIILFVYTATSKLLDFDQFKSQLRQSPIITTYADWISLGIPLLELLIAGLFLFPRFMVYAFYSSFALMVMFTTYIIIILNFSDYIPCSCGGVLEDLDWSEHIIFNLVFVFLGILAIHSMELKQHDHENSLP